MASGSLTVKKSAVLSKMPCFLSQNKTIKKKNRHTFCCTFANPVCVCLQCAPQVPQSDQLQCTVNAGKKMIHGIVILLRDNDGELIKLQDQEEIGKHDQPQPFALFVQGQFTKRLREVAARGCGRMCRPADGFTDRLAAGGGCDGTGVPDCRLSCVW